MPKKSGIKIPISAKGVKKSRRRGQKLKDIELRARLDKVVQERDEAKDKGLNPDELDQSNSIPVAISKLLKKPSRERRHRATEQLNDILDGLNDLKTDSNQ